MSRLTCTLLEHNVADETEEASEQTNGSERRPRVAQTRTNSGKICFPYRHTSFMPGYGLRGGVTDALKALLNIVEW